MTPKTPDRRSVLAQFERQGIDAIGFGGAPSCHCVLAALDTVKDLLK